MIRLRISKKILAELPPIVAEKLSTIAKRYRRATFDYYQIPAGSSLYHEEGARYWYIYGDNVTYREMASEFTMGMSAGTHDAIGARVAFPAGTTIICVSYFSKYLVSLYNFCEVPPALSTNTPLEVGGSHV